MRRLLPTLLALPLLLAPRASSAQQPAGAVEPASPGPQALMAEYQGLAEQLGRLQARALEDENLSRRSEQLVDDVEKRMAELDPATAGRLAELETLKARIDAARAAQDRAAFDESVGAARTISMQLESTRARVLEEEAYAQRTVQLQEDLLAQMTRLDPQVPVMLARLDELDRALRGGASR